METKSKTRALKAGLIAGMLGLCLAAAPALAQSTTNNGGSQDKTGHGRHDAAKAAEAAAAPKTDDKAADAKATDAKAHKKDHKKDEAKAAADQKK